MMALKDNVSTVFQSVRSLSVIDNNDGGEEHGDLADKDEEEAGLDETSLLEESVLKLSRIVSLTMGSQSHTNHMAAMGDHMGDEEQEDVNAWLTSQYLEAGLTVTACIPLTGCRFFACILLSFLPASLAHIITHQHPLLTLTRHSFTLTRHSRTLTRTGANSSGIHENAQPRAS